MCPGAQVQESSLQHGHRSVHRCTDRMQHSPCHHITLDPHLNLKSTVQGLGVVRFRQDKASNIKNSAKRHIFNPAVISSVIRLSAVWRARRLPCDADILSV